MTKEKLLEYINRGFPYPQHISDWDFAETDSIRFTWRNQRFRVQLESLMCEQVEGGCLSGSNVAILAEALIKKQMVMDSMVKK